MSDSAVLMREIEALPPSCRGEVRDFVEFLKQKNLRENRSAEYAAGLEPPEKSAAETAREMWDSLPTIEDCKREAAEKAARRKASGVKPFEGLYGVFKNSGTFAGDPAEIVKGLRDEWDVNRQDSI